MRQDGLLIKVCQALEDGDEAKVQSKRVWQQPARGGVRMPKRRVSSQSRVELPAQRTFSFKGELRGFC